MITTTCNNCRSSLDVPPHYLGKEVKCSQCGTTFVASNDFAATGLPQSLPVVSPSAAMKSCPACAEQIQMAAKKCRFCGSEFSVTITDPKKLKANNHPSYMLYTVICILIPIVGIILGIVCLAKSDPLEKKLGEHALAFSIVMMILYFLLLSFL